MDRNHYAAGGGEYHMYVVGGSQTGRGNYEKRNGMRERWETKENMDGLTNQKGG